MRSFWRLDPSITFLNHGSFGACPGEVLAAQDRVRARMEAEPVRFFIRELERLLDEARAELARFLGADTESLAFVPNATTGVNAVLRSLDFAPGDELLTTNHAYNACKNVVDYVASRAGAKVVVATIPFPIGSPGEALDAVMACVTPRTKIAMIDHVTSMTGIILPIAEIIRELDARGVDTLVDGAHAPGMVALSLTDLGAAYYTGNLHKWVCAPKGAAFLHVRADRRERVRPHVISHGASSPRGDRSRFHLEFDYVGTFDPSAYLAVPVAIAFLDKLYPGGRAELARTNREKALAVRAMLAERLRAVPPAPESMIGSLASLRLPDARDPHVGIDPLQDALLHRFRIEVPVFSYPRWPTRYIRVSAQAYNEPADYERLAAALEELFA